MRNSQSFGMESLYNIKYKHALFRSILRYSVADCDLNLWWVTKFRFVSAITDASWCKDMITSDNNKNNNRNNNNTNNSNNNKGHSLVAGFIISFFYTRRCIARCGHIISCSGRLENRSKTVSVCDTPNEWAAMPHYNNTSVWPIIIICVRTIIAFVSDEKWNTTI